MKVFLVGGADLASTLGRIPRACFSGGDALRLILVHSEPISIV